MKTEKLKLKIKNVLNLGFTNSTLKDAVGFLLFNLNFSFFHFHFLFELGE